MQKTIQNVETALRQLKLHGRDGVVRQLVELLGAPVYPMESRHQGEEQEHVLWTGSLRHLPPLKLRVRITKRWGAAACNSLFQRLRLKVWFGEYKLRVLTLEGLEHPDLLEKIPLDRQEHVSSLTLKLQEATRKLDRLGKLVRMLQLRPDEVRFVFEPKPGLLALLSFPIEQGSKLVVPNEVRMRLIARDEFHRLKAEALLAGELIA